MESKAHKKEQVVRKLIGTYLTPEHKMPTTPGHVIGQFETEGHLEYQLKISSLIKVALLALDSDEKSRPEYMDNPEIYVCDVLDIVLQLLDSNTAEFADRVQEELGSLDVKG